MTEMAPNVYSPSHLLRFFTLSNADNVFNVIQLETKWKDAILPKHATHTEQSLFLFSPQSPNAL